MTITMNNNVAFNLVNSMKLVRWDSIKTFQSEKVKILEKWFSELGMYVSITSTPVLDVTSGIVYPSTGLGFRTATGKYVTAFNKVKESVLENVPYGIHYKNICSGNHNDSLGNNVFGHYFVSVNDVSKEVLEALYAIYLDNKDKVEINIEEEYEEKAAAYVSIPSVPETAKKEVKKESKAVEKYNEIIKRLSHPEELDDSKREFQTLTTQLESWYEEIGREKVIFSGHVTITRKMIEKLCLLDTDNWFKFEEGVVEILEGGKQ